MSEDSKKIQSDAKEELKPVELSEKDLEQVAGGGASTSVSSTTARKAEEKRDV